MHLSVVIPVYNSQHLIENSLHHLTKTLDALSLDYEILLRDDGSQDRSPLLMKKMEKKLPHVTCFFNSKNSGIGWTLNALFQAAKGDIVIYTDIDLPFSTQIFPLILNAMATADLVIASRYISGSNRIMLKRKITSRFYYYLCKVLFNVPVYDIGSGSVGIKRKVLQSITLHNHGFDFHIELIMKARLRNYLIKEIPFDTHDIGRGTFSIIRHGPKVFLDTIKFWFLFIKEERLLKKSV